MNTLRRAGSRLEDVNERIRKDVPEFADAEKRLGSRLVVATNVMRLRIQRGWTQARLADELGVRQPRIAGIESARANLQVDTLDHLAEVFGVDTASLFEEEKTEPSRVSNRRGPGRSRQPEDARR